MIREKKSSLSSKKRRCLSIKQSYIDIEKTIPYGKKGTSAYEIQVNLICL
jgi:hypothetical protein